MTSYDANACARESGPAALRGALEAAPSYNEAARPRLSWPVSDFLNARIDEQQTLLTPWLRSGGLAMVHAWRGVGKTHFAIGAAVAIATGSKFLKWSADKPSRVLYVDGEMPAKQMQDRFRAATSAAKKCAPEFLRIITPDILPAQCPVPNLLTPEGQGAIEDDLQDCDVVFFDNVATLFRTADDQNSASTWLAAQDYILGLRRLGLAVVLIDHDNKSGGNRGTSSKHDVLDSVIQLKQPADYRPEQGARFEIHFTKHRGFWGRDALPFEASLIETQDGPIWTVTEAEEAERERVAEMVNEGAKEREIRAALGIGGSKLKRLKSELQDQGRISS